MYSLIIRYQNRVTNDNEEQKTAVSMLFLRFPRLDLFSQVGDVEVWTDAGVGAYGIMNLRTVVLPCVAWSVGILQELLALCPVVFHRDE